MLTRSRPAVSVAIARKIGGHVSMKKPFSEAVIIILFASCYVVCNHSKLCKVVSYLDPIIPIDGDC